MSSYHDWVLQVDPSVLKILKKFPEKDTRRILEVLRYLPTDPYFGDIQKLKGHQDEWRRRIGAYRVFYSIRSHIRTILVFHVEKRVSKTYS